MHKHVEYPQCSDQHMTNHRCVESAGGSMPENGAYELLVIIRNTCVMKMAHNSNGCKYIIVNSIQLVVICLVFQRQSSYNLEYMWTKQVPLSYTHKSTPSQ